MNRQADPARCPPYPDGFPRQMLVYRQWQRDFGVHPRDVERLTRGELFWLPLLAAAEEEAAETLRPKEDKQR
jgi:hypothetical protein